MKKNKFIVLILVVLFSASMSAQFSLEEAFPNLSFANALYLTHSGDGSNRIFVVELSGRIQVFDNSPSVSTKDIFLDITDRVSLDGEGGLLGLAFHPDYETNGYFYVNYTTSNTQRTIISRFQVSATNPDSADENSEFELLNFNQPFRTHNGGWIGFRQTDGYLYIATGDGGSGGDPQNNGQNITTMLGKILRIDVDNQDLGLNYSIPPDNPFVDSTGNVVKEIYAWGLRNPWRCSFDPVTDFFWVADVGQADWEEIDIVENGKNYGWRCYEGTRPFNLSGCNYPEYIDPIWEYNHPTGFSVTGGYVYRGQNVPELNGKYIYGDFVTSSVWALEYDGINPPTNELLLTAVGNITSFGVDQNDELYITSFNGNIYRFAPSGTITAPTNLDGTGSITPSIPPKIIVDLTWIDNSNDEDGFVIERKIENGGFEVIDSVSANVEAYMDGDLADSVTYTYRVAAFNSSHFSAYSNEFSVSQTLAGEPIFTGQPLGRAVKQGMSVTLQVTAAGTGAISLQWKKDGVDLAGQTSSTLPLTNFQAADAGSYTVVATNAEGNTTSEAAVLSLVTGESRVVAISTRGAIGTGPNVLIAGLVLSSGNAQNMLLTGVGPSMEGKVGGFLTDSRITVFQGPNPIYTNDDWGQAGNAASIPGTASSVGALSIDYANQTKDAAVLESFSGGVYTAHVSGVNSLTGIGITEAFEATTSPSPGAVSILGISTRGAVGTGAEILIGGFVVRGNSPVNLLIGGGGPELTNRGVNSADVLSNPQLTLYQGPNAIASNDDWGDNATAPSIASAFTEIGATAYANGSKDAAIFVTLNPGVYTVHLSGVGDLTGVAIVEIFVVP